MSATLTRRGVDVQTGEYKALGYATDLFIIVSEELRNTMSDVMIGARSYMPKKPLTKRLTFLY